MALQVLESSAIARDRKPDSRYYIDGVSVESLFEEIYDTVKRFTETTRFDLLIDLITWKPLVAAADRSILHGVLLDITTRIICTAREGRVILRAYPSHDDTCVTFQVTVKETGSQSVVELNTIHDVLASSRVRITRMGGEFTTVRITRESASIWFWLPQWIVCEHECSAAAWQKAA